jgi:hypothetical protein
MEQLPLKDIHLPEPVSFWPPAPGWIVLALLLPLSIALLIYVYKRLKQQTVSKSAAKLLAGIRSENSADSRKTLVALSALLRRVAISTTGRADVAGLNGAAWLAYLDTPFPDAPFSQGIGRCLAYAHYRPTLPTETDLDELFKLCERWIKQQTSGKANSEWKRRRLGGKQ